MPKAQSRKEPGKIALDKESLSSASQLAHFGVRLAKFTHDVSSDTAANFSSNYVLPAKCAIISAAIYVDTAYDGTTVTADIQAGGSTILSAPISVEASGVAVQDPSSLAQESGELSVVFSATDSTEGKATFTVAYIDLSELS